jgi:uroporphyrinogen-III decarboxylase
MSFEDGWAALNLDMPPRVPRTEYSADTHWSLVREVTGRQVDEHSDADTRRQASDAFRRAWNYDLVWSVLINADELDALRTDMGHAEYATGGTDRRDAARCPFQEPEQLLALEPMDVYGRRDHGELVRRFEEHYRRQADADPSAVRMTGVYTTCISGLIEIAGWDMLLMAAGIDPQAFGELTSRYCRWNQQFFDALGDADVPVVMVHDDIVWTSGPFLRPDWYREYVFPNYRRLLAPLIDSGKRVLYTSDGDYTAFLDDIVDCGVHGLVMEPMTDMAAVAERFGRTHAFIGNADTRILLGGTRAEIRAEVERCLAIGKDCPGFVMAVGNHIPSNTPVDNARYYNEVYQELSAR